MSNNGYQFCSEVKPLSTDTGQCIAFNLQGLNRPDVMGKDIFRNRILLVIDIWALHSSQSKDSKKNTAGMEEELLKSESLNIIRVIQFQILVGFLKFMFLLSG